jgi:hypothetical protein
LAHHFFNLNIHITGCGGGVKKTGHAWKQVSMRVLFMAIHSGLTLTLSFIAGVISDLQQSLYSSSFPHWCSCQLLLGPSKIFWLLWQDVLPIYDKFDAFFNGKLYPLLLPVRAASQKIGEELIILFLL